MNLYANCFLVAVLSIGGVACTSVNEPPEVNEGELLIHDSAVYYKTIGTGEPILILHGGPVLDHSYLLPQFETLADEYQLVFFDQRASGRSSVAVDSSSMSIAGFVEDIEQIRKDLQLEKVHLLGHSWGGLLAMHYAIRYPDHLRSLILSNSLPASQEEWQQEQAQLAEKVSVTDSLARQAILQSGSLQTDPAATVKKLLLLSFKPQFHDPTLLDSLSLWVPDDYMARSQAFQYLAPDLAAFDLYTKLAQVQVPTLIVYGDQESAAHQSAKRLAAVMPQASLHLIEQSGHFPFVEQPALYFSAIRNFLP